MQEFATVRKTAEARLLVVFANIRGEVGDCDGANVCGGFDGTDGTGGGVGVLLDVGFVVCSAFVGAIVCDFSFGAEFWRAGARGS